MTQEPTRPAPPPGAPGDAICDLEAPPRIDGVVVRELRWRADQRGALVELVRADDPELMAAPFGQVYVTTVRPGVVKGWHRHRRQWDRIACVSGHVLLGLVDGRAGSPTEGAAMGLLLGERTPAVVLVPPGVWHGLKNVGESEAFVVNVVSEPHDRARPDEERAPAHGALPFDWTRTDR